MSTISLQHLLELPDKTRSRLHAMLEMKNEHGFATVRNREKGTMYTATWDGDTFLCTLSPERLMLEKDPFDMMEKHEVLSRMKSKNAYGTVTRPLQLPNGEWFVPINKNIEKNMSILNLAVYYEVCDPYDVGLQTFTKAQTLGSRGCLYETSECYVLDLYNNTNAMVLTEFDKNVGEGLLNAATQLNAEIARQVLAYRLSGAGKIKRKNKLKDVTKDEDFLTWQWETDSYSIAADFLYGYTYIMPNLTSEESGIYSVRWVLDQDALQTLPSYSARITIKRKK